MPPRAPKRVTTPEPGYRAFDYTKVCSWCGSADTEWWVTLRRSGVRGRTVLLLCRPCAAIVRVQSALNPSVTYDEQRSIPHRKDNLTP